MSSPHQPRSTGDDYERTTYGDLWAPYYDKVTAPADEATIDFLFSLAGSPPRALELAIGTGRLAIPLVERGVAVTGVDVSGEMVGILRAKSGGEDIQVVMGDMAEVDLNATFPLVYLAFNTLFALLDQERQVACFKSTARHLESGGRFVLDCFVPDLTRYDSYNTRMAVSSIISNQSHAYEMSIHDPVSQKVVSHQVRRLEDGETVVLPVTIRYAWPAEMDLMAGLAGLELEERFGWYDRRPFTESSHQHVSVYRKP
ncbi:MAG: class I SAM-dependent methyltransferase [Actinobacteria bacterium]|nr:class I SAM-dependent methyltransferase [Actinomycetota bacterium]MCI0543835.1 class I SAM-dependent methyltransferase [Actinomycetota bacterium]MCI0678116.1 class I SAM-dependent methyltransferase [Actinomycetota bacterium]